jgi:hypothetical protein
LKAENIDRKIFQERKGVAMKRIKKEGCSPMKRKATPVAGLSVRLML